MSEGSQPKTNSSDKSGAEGRSTKRNRCDADLDKMKLSPMIRNLVENMTEEHWRVVRGALCVPGTREEVCRLCASIVKNVVQTARYYLIPALNKIGVPVQYMIVCGVTKSGNYPCRVGTSEAKISGMHKGTQELAPAVVVTEQAETSGHSASGPVLHQFSSAAFQERAAKKVSEVLLQIVQSDSCPESHAGENMNDEQASAEAVSLTDLCELHTFVPSGQLSQSIADDLVGDVIEAVEERVSDQEVNSAAYDVVGRVMDGLKDLLTTQVTVCMKRIHMTAQQMFNSIQNTVGNVFSKFVHFGGKEDIKMASAKNLISQVILSMLSELPDPQMSESSEQIELMSKILSAVLDEVQMTGTDAERSETPRLPLPRSSRSEDDDQVKLPGTPAGAEVLVERMSPVLTHTFVDMDATSVSPACANATIASVIDRVLDCGKLGPITGRPDKLSCEAKIMEYSSDIADQVQKILRNYHGLQTISVPVGKSLSDSVLCKLPTRAKGTNEMPSGFIYNYVEETVKRFVLSCLFPSVATENQEQPHNTVTTKSPAEVFDGTVNLFTHMMTKDVLMTLSTEVEGKAAASDTVDDFQELAREDEKLLDDQVADIESRPSTASSDLLLCVSGAREDQCDGVRLSSYLLLSESKNDYASIVSMLVIRLLSQVNTLQQSGLSENMLDLSTVLIQKILSELHTAFGIACGDNSPEQVNLHQIYRNVYKDLIQEFGSESGLHSALESQDPSSERSLINKMTKEIAKSCGRTPASSDITPIQAGIALQGQNKATTRKKMFPFRLRMPAFKLKKSKKGSHDAPLTESQTSPDAMMTSSQVLLTKTSPRLNETLAEVSEAQALAGPLEMPEEEATIGCCSFRMPKLKFSFKKMMKGAKFGHTDHVKSGKDNSNVPASCDTQ